MPISDRDLSRLVDEAGIRYATARFADAGSFGDYDGFRALWAEDGIWTIGKPFEARAEGQDDIVALFKKLKEPKEFFVQFAFQGPIVIDGDTARTRSLVHEEGRGPGDTGFRCHSVTNDLLRRAGEHWVFVRRAFQYIWLDTASFAGDVFPVSPPETAG